MPHVAEVRGLGMMLGVKLDKGSSREAAEKCLENGLLILTANAPAAAAAAEYQRGGNGQGTVHFGIHSGGPVSGPDNERLKGREFP